MARKRERAFAAFGAALFLITSSALTIAVVWSLVSQKSSSNNTNQTASTAFSCPKAPSATTPNKLTGTMLSNFSPTSKKQNQLQSIDITPGTGAVVQATNTITADYRGALMCNGVIFDASADHGGPQTFSLNQVIPGWTQGIPGMKAGGTRRLLIPSALAYGSQGSGSTIPPNADLVFDVTVTKIN